MSNSPWYQSGKFHRSCVLVNKKSGVRADESVENEYFLLKSTKKTPVVPVLYHTNFLGCICADAEEVAWFTKRMNEKHTNVSCNYDKETNTHSFYSNVKNENLKEENDTYFKLVAEYNAAFQKFSEYCYHFDDGPAIERSYDEVKI
jgi:hypothetical protein